MTDNAFKTRTMFDGKIGTDGVESQPAEKEAPEPAPGKI